MTSVTITVHLIKRLKFSVRESFVLFLLVKMEFFKVTISPLLWAQAAFPSLWPKISFYLLNPELIGLVYRLKFFQRTSLHVSSLKKIGTNNNLKIRIDRNIYFLGQLIFENVGNSLFFSWTASFYYFSPSSIFISIHFLALVPVLKQFNLEDRVEARDRAIFLFQKFFSSSGAVGEGILAFLSDRLFPHNSNDYEYWNGPTQGKFYYWLWPFDDFSKGWLRIRLRVRLRFRIIFRVSFKLKFKLKSPKKT